VEEPDWRRTLHDGYRPSNGDFALGFNSTKKGFPPLDPPGEHRLHVLIRPDPHLLDGRFANNSWLQELPKPITRLTWGNAIHISPRTAADFHLAHGDEVELISGDRKVRGPIYILAGHADGCATIHLGGGRTHAGRVGNGVGFDASPLQTFASRWLCRDVEARRTGRKHVFAAVQHQRDMAGRHPVRVVKAGEALAASEIAAESLYPPARYTSPSWGMVIDLNTCTGCGTCTIACQAENNIPVVGRAEVLRGRVMHWIRVDQYMEGGDQPQFLHQPVPCMHCENAPCEVVCPVAATVHDHQGLNVMVYNRCIGTRYCSNNCPYKVRRFNFFQYSDLKSPQLRLQRNPEVTVRERGVMEKCTYCVQRINAARITADVENRAIRDGEVVPACAQACPANAIVFGDIMDPSSKVSAARREPRHYALLEELNTRPRTTYLARVTNSNPEMSK
jgi:molybdopterin-containing oxidoreductase family iron-sulfur binding subunit